MSSVYATFNFYSNTVTLDVIQGIEIELVAKRDSVNGEIFADGDTIVAGTKVYFTGTITTTNADGKTIALIDGDEGFAILDASDFALEDTIDGNTFSFLPWIAEAGSHSFKAEIVVD